MNYYGKPSSRNSGISKWRRPSTNDGLHDSVSCYDDFCSVLLSRLKELGACILPGGKGQPQIIVSPRYTRLKTIKGEWPILRTGIIPDYEKWATDLVKEYPDKFAQHIVVYQRTVPENNMRQQYKRSGPGVVYFIGSDESNYVKIGTTIDIEKRIAGIQTSIPFDLKILLIISGGKNEERKTHSAFEQYRKRGEWFNNTGKLKMYLDYMSDNKNPHVEPWEFAE